MYDILIIALCAIPCDDETCPDMALFTHSKRDFPESFLPLRNGIPSHGAFPIPLQPSYGQPSRLPHPFLNPAQLNSELMD
jgi:hypothetical protein